jgi:hypothetical protein
MDPVLGTLCLLSIAGLAYIAWRGFYDAVQSWKRRRWVEIDDRDWGADRLSDLAEMQRLTEYEEK